MAYFSTGDSLSPVISKRASGVDGGTGWVLTRGPTGTLRVPSTGPRVSDSPRRRDSGPEKSRRAQIRLNHAVRFRFQMRIY